MLTLICLSFMASLGTVLTLITQTVLIGLSMPMVHSRLTCMSCLQGC